MHDIITCKVLNKYQEIELNGGKCYSCSVCVDITDKTAEACRVTLISIQILYWSKSRNTVVDKYFITSKSPEYKMLL